MEVAKYTTYEARFTARAERPFDVPFSAVFTCPNGEKKRVGGFYDGEDTFVLRFLPEEEGEYSFITKCTLSALDQKKGAFTCSGVKGHGKVVADGTFLRHQDGTRHFSVGTTCYAWLYQSESVREETLRELSNGYFNKLRMCVFPKWYEFCHEEPEIYPFAGKPNAFDYDTPNVAFFRMLDGYVKRLDEMGIQADIILFHPYDAPQWGFSRMTKAQDTNYLRYVISRLAAFPNVWWSAANEYDLFAYNKENYKCKDKAWKGIVREISTFDRFGHLLGIHQCHKFYDHGDKHITHCSLQRTNLYLTTEETCLWQKKYFKPVVWDEIAYEGNIKPTFGNCSPEELVRSCWEASVRGGYAGHGETYYDANDILWWAKGGCLHGESHKRLKFLREVFASYGDPQLTCYHSAEAFPRGDFNEEVVAYYFGNTTAIKQDIYLPHRNRYLVEVVDTWNMERRVLDGEYSGITEIPLPQKTYIAVFARKVSGISGIPKRFTDESPFSEMRHYKGGKFVYFMMTKTPVLRGNDFVLGVSLKYLKETTGGAVSDKLVKAVVSFINDGKFFKFLARLLKK